MLIYAVFFIISNDSQNANCTFTSMSISCNKVVKGATNLKCKKILARKSDFETAKSHSFQENDRKDGVAKEKKLKWHTQVMIRYPVTPFPLTIMLTPTILNAKYMLSTHVHACFNWSEKKVVVSTVTKQTWTLLTRLHCRNRQSEFKKIFKKIRFGQHCGEKNKATMARKHCSTSGVFSKISSAR